MKNEFLSQTRINRIKKQGYKNYSNIVINDLTFGNRFAYQLCTFMLFVGVSLCNNAILNLMMGIALLAVVLPNHPFDYIYNILLAKRLGKPQLPPRSKLLKFACILATIWIGTTMYLANSGMMSAAFVMGYSLVIVALLVSTIDYCIPSILFNMARKALSETSAPNLIKSHRS